VLSYLHFQRTMTKEHLSLVTPRILQYVAYYQNETWRPLQAEIGFSKSLYEDDNHLIVYEGKIDLLMEVQGIKAFVDHKSQSRHRNLPEDSNQFLGYAWATGFRLGIINFLNLAPSKSTKDAFRREICNYNPQLVEEWKEGAIETGLKMADSIRREHYPKQRQGCNGVYGLCDFIKKEPWSPWELLGDNDDGI
jgi:hypothetical protein